MASIFFADWRHPVSVRVRDGRVRLPLPNAVVERDHGTETASPSFATKIGCCSIVGSPDPHAVGLAVRPGGTWPEADCRRRVRPKRRMLAGYDLLLKIFRRTKFKSAIILVCVATT